MSQNEIAVEVAMWLENLMAIQCIVALNTFDGTPSTINFRERQKIIGRELRCKLRGKVGYILSAEAKGNDGSSIAEHCLQHPTIQLLQVLMGENKTNVIFA